MDKLTPKQERFANEYIKDTQRYSKRYKGRI